jgi:hypothetical protein
MKILSGLVIFISPVLILSYDALAYVIGGNAATISRIALDTATRYPSFKYSTCWLFGALCAHLFAPRPGTGSPSFPWLPIAAAVGVPLIVAFVNLAFFLWPELSSRLMTTEADSWRGIVPVIGWLIFGVVVGFVAVAQHTGA